MTKRKRVGSKRGLVPNHETVPQYRVSLQISEALARLRRGGLGFLARRKPKYKA